LLGDGPAELQRRTGVPTLGVLPWISGIELDAEDSLALARPRFSPDGPTTIDVAAIRFPRISNFTDLDALAIEAGVGVRLVDQAASLGRPDVIVMPGTKATMADLAWLRRSGLAEAITTAAADPRTTVVGICGGYQMLGRTLDDPIPVESNERSHVLGLGLLPVATVFAAAKITRTRSGVARDRTDVAGYEIHHGCTRPANPWLSLDPGAEPEGSASEDGSILGTSLHGLWESDAFRAAFLSEVATRAGKPWRPSGRSFAAARQARFDRLADLMEAHLDMAALGRLIDAGAPPQ
jgi:adenosylcobyric acid synthase